MPASFSFHAMAVRDRVHVIHHAIDRCDLGVIRARRRKARARLSVIEEMPLVRQRGIDLAPEEQGSEVRPIHFI